MSVTQKIGDTVGGELLELSKREKYKGQEASCPGSLTRMLHDTMSVHVRFPGIEVLKRRICFVTVPQLPEL
jgi:hypothetical protein